MRIHADIKNRFNQIEFWALTSVFSVGLLFFTWQALGAPSSDTAANLKDTFSDAGIQFGYYKHYFIPTVIRFITYFVCFMYLNFRLLPVMVEEGVKWIPLTKIAVGLLMMLVVNVATDYYLHADWLVSFGSEDKGVDYIWQSNLIYTLWLSFAFATYTLFKYGGLLLLTYFEKNEPRVAYLRETALMAWIMVILIGLVLSFFSSVAVSLLWITVVPVLAIFYYLGLYKFIPFALSKKRSKLWYAILVVVYSFLAWCLIAGIVQGISYYNHAGLIGAFSTVCFLLIVGAPALWVWYHYQQRQKGSVKVLEQKLGQSTAQLDQLRAQINPHFLFNALNTVYGLALTEKAEQSADAIEKISEMMRFMLRENQEEKISLEKDLDYLKNYMGIQQMRLGPNPNIELSVEIPEVISPSLTIAPMLLIPFVENAFKHGISLQSHSFIRLTIQIEGNKLVFSLHNSTHDRIWLDDPEKNNHGIGMNNVKQRLALLYPGRHLLSVKENGQSFNVDLTILL
jgi:sensor histidine kinase YesM